VEEVRRLGFANNAAAMRDRNIRERLAILETYGGAKCACCGEIEESFLSLDHIDQNGAAERVAFFKNKYIAGHHMYRELRLRGYPPGVSSPLHELPSGPS
jgi:hypothetical protein